ncbi:hypothetical protein MBAV_006291 [Candidatus Magnetobacterium bavaricum]|uniref:Uncharacterized protein n=1 Tax=Candidatus Magnetobacterium bavaricum TaxID=29290 RepID=A0A0F3GI67_9BACT|nr:hypothetical protein MBAV_006291 [Candidatus Magnetobacterium bavaricum]
MPVSPVRHTGTLSRKGKTPLMLSMPLRSYPKRNSLIGSGSLTNLRGVCSCLLS